MLSIYKDIAMALNSPSAKEKENDYAEMRADFEDYLKDASTKSIFTVNEIPYAVSIQDVSEQNNKDLRDDKYLLCSLDTPLKVGDVGIWDKGNLPYLITGKENLTIPTKQKFKIQPCNYELKWVDMAEKIDKKCRCVVEDATMYTDGLKEENVVSYSDKMVRIIIPTNVEKNFKEDKRLFVDGKFYKITSINRLTDGVTRIMALTTLKSEQDNEELGIADYYLLDRSSKPVSSLLNIKITGKSVVYVGSTNEYIAEISDDKGNILTNKIATFSVSENATILNTDGNKLRIKASNTPFVDIVLSADCDGFNSQFVIKTRRL